MGERRGRRAGRAQSGGNLDAPGTVLPPPPADWQDLAYAAGPPLAIGHLRAAPEDFRVVEELGFAPSGDGDHVLLRLRKRGANTDWVARQVADVAGVTIGRVSYAGLKDRHAVTEQTFSILLPGKGMPDWSALESADLEVLEAARNRRMVRRGGLKGNRFILVVRELKGLRGAEPPRAAMDERLGVLATAGVPNYFGPQRFGLGGGGNLSRALAIFAGATESRSYKRGLYISAARSYLFNRLLSARVTAGSWNRALPGEALALEGTRSFFVAETLDEAIERRLAALDLHPTGPLWGLGESPARDEALRVEQEALADLGEWRAGLEAYGARANRRALRVKLRELSWRWLDDGSLELAFGLPPGAYATSALRELLDTGTEPEDEGEAED